MGRVDSCWQEASATAPKQAILFMIRRKSTMCSDGSSTLGSGVLLSHLLNVVLYTMSVFAGL